MALVNTEEVGLYNNDDNNKNNNNNDFIILNCKDIVKLHYYLFTENRKDVTSITRTDYQTQSTLLVVCHHLLFVIIQKTDNMCKRTTLTAIQ